MTNEITLSTSRLEKLNNIVAFIESSPRATEEQAAEIVHRLMAAYPQQKANDPQTYFSLLVLAIAGADLDLAKQLVHPRLGLRSKFLPTTAEVVDWLDAKLGARQRELERAKLEMHTLISRQEYQPPSAEERVKVAAMAAKAKRSLAAAAEAMSLRKPNEGEGRAGGEKASLGGLGNLEGEIDTTGPNSLGVGK